MTVNLLPLAFIRIKSIIYTSTFAYFAFASINARRGGTSSPINIENTRSAPRHHQWSLVVKFEQLDPWWFPIIGWHSSLQDLCIVGFLQSYHSLRCHKPQRLLFVHHHCFIILHVHNNNIIHQIPYGNLLDMASLWLLM